MSEYTRSDDRGLERAYEEYSSYFNRSLDRQDQAGMQESLDAMYLIRQELRSRGDNPELLGNTENAFDDMQASYNERYVEEEERRE